MNEIDMIAIVAFGLWVWDVLVTGLLYDIEKRIDRMEKGREKA